MAHVRIRHEARRAGTEWRARTCSHCGSELAFPVHHQTFAWGSTGAQARASVEKEFQSQIAKVVAPTRCPVCGRLQADMVREAQRLAVGGYYAAVFGIALLAIAIAALFGSPGARNEIRFGLISFVTGVGANLWNAIAHHGWLLLVLIGSVVAWFGVDLGSRRVSEERAAKAVPEGLTREAFEAKRASDPSVPAWTDLVRR